GLACEYDGLGATADGQFVEDVGDRVAHGFFRDLEPCGDAAVVQSARQQIEDLALAACQRRKRSLPARALVFTRQKRADLFYHFLERGLALQWDVVIGLQGDEACARDRRSDQPHFLDGDQQRLPTM